MDNCLICFEPNHYLRSRLPDCNRCNVYYHIDCYEGIKKLGLNCPICRKPDPMNYYEKYYIGYFEYVSILFKFLEATVFKLFMNKPNLLTYILLQLISIPILFLIITPYTLFICLMISLRKINRIIYLLGHELLFRTPILPSYLLEDIRIYFR